MALVMSGDPQDRHPRVVPSGVANIRWTPERKVAVLLALDLGEISEDEVRPRYAMHPDELSAWRGGA
jgi:hypothetical protein